MINPQNYPCFNNCLKTKSLLLSRVHIQEGISESCESVHKVNAFHNIKSKIGPTIYQLFYRFRITLEKSNTPEL